MVEAHRLDWSLFAIGTAEQESRQLGDGTDAIELRPSRGGDEQPCCVIRRNDQAQLKVLTVVERVIERRRAIALAHFMSISMDGNRGLVEYGSQAAAFLEDVAQVGR